MERKLRVDRPVGGTGEVVHKECDVCRVDSSRKKGVANQHQSSHRGIIHKRSARSTTANEVTRGFRHIHSAITGSAGSPNAR
jgi:hypothetical protein